MMNQEKLRELCQHAGFDVAALIKPYPGGFPREDMLALESLVTLVVEECMGIANSIGEHGYIAAQEMKEHFGLDK
jgi:hypothetical protein